jgi:hypothetical protein
MPYRLFDAVVDLAELISIEKSITAAVKKAWNFKPHNKHILGVKKCKNSAY